MQVIYFCGVVVRVTEHLGSNKVFPTEMMSNKNIKVRYSHSAETVNYRLDVNRFHKMNKLLTSPDINSEEHASCPLGPEMNTTAQFWKISPVKCIFTFIWEWISCSTSTFFQHRYLYKHMVNEGPLKHPVLWIPCWC